ncbi:MAG: four helix bundle suffix domain-containing protein [Tannerellaceae bacterium]|jgi:four helix bundle suffix protein|nr:four helix bundle suffix domain-containing protein [Tannerellaceae bacterium]
MPNKTPPLIPPTKDYRKLYSYRKSVAIFDITYYFCQTYLRRGDRTVDQMVQAARSGKQNITEGSAAANTSKETEIKLINVAKASLLELHEDYLDFLRTRNLRLWEDGSVEQLKMRELARTYNDSAFYMDIVSTRPPETIANIAICLLKQTDYLLAKHLQKLSEQFLTDGGFRERMAKMRLDQRQNKT